jgi:hypothetical protein
VALVLFDAIPTGWVSKHYSGGLIWLQRRRCNCTVVGVSQNFQVKGWYDHYSGGALTLKLYSVGVSQNVTITA